MRIAALDLIRFFAALSVVLYHYISRPSCNAYPLISEITKFGYLGVPLFFIISGFVISLSADNRSALHFCISRLVRLYPALWSGVIFTSLILLMFTGKKHSISQILSNFTLLNEYIGFNNIDNVYWTLKAELKFYVCVFLLLAFGLFQKYRIWLSIWLLMTATHAIFRQPFFMGWFISPGYSPFFIAGVTFYLIHTNKKNTFVIFALLFSLVLASFRAYGQADGFMQNPSIVEKLGSVAIIWLFFIIMYFLSAGKINISNKNVYSTLGALTYPLYLIHNKAGKAIIDTFSNIFSEKLMIVIVVIFMILMAWVIHLIVEKPLATPMKNYLLSVANKFKTISTEQKPQSPK